MGRCSASPGRWPSCSTVSAEIFAANQTWCELVALAQDPIAWAQTLALTRHDARRGEPKRLRLRLFSAAARLVHTGRRRRLLLAATGPAPATSPPRSPRLRPGPVIHQRLAKAPEFRA